MALTVLNPATEQPIAELQQAGVEETDAAVARARDAYPAWRAVAPADRARLLRRLATLVEKEGEGIAGGIGTSQDGSSHVTFYVAVDDPQAALDKAEALGGKTVQPVMTIPDMVTLALFADPEGHVVGVVASERPTA